MNAQYIIMKALSPPDFSFLTCLNSVCVCVLSHFSHVQLFFSPMDCSPPSSSVHGILQARILDWDAMPSSRWSSKPRDQTGVSCISYNAGGFFTHWVNWASILNFSVTYLSLVLCTPWIHINHKSLLDTWSGRLVKWECIRTVFTLTDFIFLHSWERKEDR